MRLLIVKQQDTTEIDLDQDALDVFLEATETDAQEILREYQHETLD